MKRKAIIVGATGRVGQALTRELAALYETLIVVARIQPRYFSDNMHFYQVTDFSNLAQTLSAVPLDAQTDAFCCLWVNEKEADSDEAFWRIHYDYPLLFAQTCQNKGVRRCFVLSVAGAHAKSGSALLKAKGELEKAVASLGFEMAVSFRLATLTLPKEFSLRNLTHKATHFVMQILPRDKALHPEQVAMSMALVAYQTWHNPNYISTLKPLTKQKQLGLWIVQHKQMLALTDLG